MRGFIGALLVIPALASRSEPWERVDESPIADKSIAYVDVPVQDKSDGGRIRMGLGLKLQVLPSEAVCGFGNVTLDDQVLPQTLVDDFSLGQGSVALDHEKTIDASWTFHCVNVNGIPNSQLMKFFINTIDGKAVKDVGFSALFRQSGVSEIINIETDLSIPDEILGNPNPEALEPLHHTQQRPHYNLEEDLAELDYLFWQMRELKHLIHEKKRTIAHHGHKHFEHDKEVLAQCDSLKCVARTVAMHAKNAAHHLYGKIGGNREHSVGRHHSEEPHFPKHHDCHGKNCTRVPDHPNGNHTHSRHPHPHRPLPVCRFPPPPGQHHDGPPHGHSMPSHPDFDGHREGPSDFDSSEEHHRHHERPDFDGPPRHHGEEHHEMDGPFEKHHGGKPHHDHEDGPPRHHNDEDKESKGPSEKDHGGKPHHDHEDGIPSKHHESEEGSPEFNHPTFHQPPHDGPPQDNSHEGPPPQMEEHTKFDGPPGPHHGPPYFALSVAKYSVIGFLFAFLLLAIRRRCCTPARRADRQARREERHRRRAYRRAAHKHIISRILARISGDGSEDESDDYEEKREALLADAEDGLSTTMTEEIIQTRNAAGVVGEMVDAEEERAVSSNEVLAHIGGEELPAYEDDESDEGSFIADGFAYTPGSSNYSPSQSGSGNVSDILGPDSKS